MKLPIFLVMSIGVAAFMSCKRENQSQNNLDQEMAFANHISEFANLHDDGLDYLFEQLSNPIAGRAAEIDISVSGVVVQPTNPNGPPTLANPNLIPQYTIQFMKSKLNLNMDSISKVNPGIIDNNTDVTLLLFDHQRYWISDYFKYVFIKKFSSRLATALNNFQLIIENNTDTFKIRKSYHG